MTLSRLEEIVQQSGSLSGKEREEFLSTLCAEDPAMATVARRILAFPASTDPPDKEAASPIPETVSSSGRLSATGPLGSKRVDQDWAVLPVNTVLAHRYRIDAYLASGGMGQVYRVRDLELDASLALKTLRPDVASDPVSLRRFKQEVLLARSVTHPHVCRVFDLGRDEERGVTFLTMEYLPGETLRAHLQEHGRLGAEQAMSWVRQLAEALDSAHRAGIVHRDFKSANVMVVQNAEGSQVVITDFGLAMAIERGRPMDASSIGVSQGQTDSLQPGPIMGTPAYMAPEQVRGGPVGPASDLYALGVVLFEMRTGQLPFPTATPREAALAHLTMDPPNPRTLGPIEEPWERTILRLLSKNPGERFASARDVVYALEGQLEREAVARYLLPPEPDAFVGRTGELRRLAEALEGSNGSLSTRLLSVVGPGGSGKTRLATSYGWASLNRWPGGVWFCDLSEARSREGIVSAVAMALEVPLGKEDPIVQLGHAIAGRGKSLLVLDNFEQVAAYAAPTLGRWLERATETRFLVTSRERLHLPGETVLDLEPLDARTHGLELFERRAQAHRPGFAVHASNRAHVEEIVGRLEGLPLAIELAAARLRMLSLEQLRERLRDRFHVLTGGERGRHATLRTTLDWSWDLLEPWEQTMLAQVSVFEGGFTLEAAEAVVDLGEYASERFVLDGIQSLADKSWLKTRVVREAPRFDLYVTLQEYASEKLQTVAGAGHATGAEVRHGRYFARMGTEDALESLDRHGGVARLQAMQPEVENLVAACHRALARDDARTAVATCCAASEVLRDREARTVVQLGREVLANVTEFGDRARVYHTVGISERLLGLTHEAREDLEAALAIYRNLGDRGGEGTLLGTLGVLHNDQGRMEVAREHFEAALAICREVRDRRGEGNALANLGGLDREQRRMEQARQHGEAALAIYREMGNRRGEGVALNRLGIVQQKQDRLEEAREYFEAALAIHREVGDRNGEAKALGNLGILHRLHGQMEEARERYRATLAICREVGSRPDEGRVLMNLAYLGHVRGRTEEAREHYQAALAIFREVNNRGGEGTVLNSLGILDQEQGRMDQAREYYLAALEIHREVGNRSGQGFALANLGALYQGQGRTEEAREHYQAALAIHRDLRDGREVGKVLAAMAEFEMSEGNLEVTRVLLAEAQAIVSDLALPPDSELARKIEGLQRRAGG